MILFNDLTVDSLEAGTFLTFQVRLISNPMTLRPTSSFKMYLTTSISQNYYVNQLVSGASIINIHPGTLRNVRISPDNNAFGVTTDYSIYVTLANPTPKGSTIQIQFPQKYYPNLASITCTSLKAVSSTMKCAVSSSKANVLLLSNVFVDEGKIAGTEIGIRLQNVKNPDKSVE